MFSSFMHLNNQMNVPADDQFMRGIQIIQHPLINGPEKKIDHFNERIDKGTGKPIEIDHLVLHCSCEPDIEDVLDKRGLSAHYVIHKDGTILQCVDESKRAYHAYPAFWDKVGGRENNMNAHSIGIEIENPTFGAATHYTDAAMISLIPLCNSIIARHHIPPHNVIGHSDINPVGKADPGRLFPWMELSKEGIGLYPEKESERVFSSNPEELLQIIGYNTENIPATMQAFKRHFMPDALQYEATGSDEKATLKFMENYSENMAKLLPQKITVTPPEIQRLQEVAKIYQMSRTKMR